MNERWKNIWTQNYKDHELKKKRYLLASTDPISCKGNFNFQSLLNVVCTLNLTTS